MTTPRDARLRVGVMPLARSTFDMEYAAETASAAFALLERSGHELVGSRALLCDAASAERASAELAGAGLDVMLILQVTFTDSTATLATAAAVDAPLAIWAFPEPRSGGRLRLNSFCGLNLAAHALALNGREFRYLYGAPAANQLARVAELLAGNHRGAPLQPQPARANEAALARGREVVEGLRGVRIGRIGAHPEGFETCAFDPGLVNGKAGVEVTDMAISALFEQARAIPEAAVAATRTLVSGQLAELDQVDQEELDRSLRLKNALDQLQAREEYSAFAIRCWPETFTEYGGAVCGPVSMMGERRVPCSCEADVHGALTSLVLQTLADAPVFQVDLVDLDAADDTGVVWHCGQAPISMADPEPAEGEAPRATIHTNRRMPLLYEFALKPGRVTLARISQARGAPALVIAGGEMLRRPMSFTGTSGVIRFDAGAGEVLDRLLASGLEHHACLAYGDWRAELHGVAAALEIPVLLLT